MAEGKIFAFFVTRFTQTLFYLQNIIA